MPRIKVEIEESEVEGDYGTVEGVIAACTRCGYTSESAGTGGGEPEAVLGTHA
jgi:hypothetical protein